MTGPTTPDEWANKLRNIASAIRTTCYDHGTKLGQGPHAERQISYDDSDYLVLLSKALLDPTFAVEIVKALVARVALEEERRADAVTTLAHIRDDLTHRLAADEAKP